MPRECPFYMIEKARRNIVYTDFVDEIGAPTDIDLPGVTVGMDFERFKAKPATSSRPMKITSLFISSGPTSR